MCDGFNKIGVSGTERSRSNLEGNQQPSKGDTVPCLLLTTDLAFEIWLVKPNLNHGSGSGAGHHQGLPTNVELECVYRHKEDKVEMIDFLHMSHEVYSRTDSFYFKINAQSD
jgi:hypothetical protein